MNKYFLYAGSALLLLLTVVSSAYVGYSSYEEPVELGFAEKVIQGLPFSVAVIIVFLSHSLGHYFVARKYDVVDGPPYFIPSLNPVGTSGAFLRMNWPFESRNALLGVFLAGPITGFIVAAIFYIWGCQSRKWR